MLRTALILLLVLAPPALAGGDADRDGDGYPDAVEITDSGEREAFLDWFAAV